MYFKKITFGLLCMLLFVNKVQAQGPPITVDKPILLGSDSWVLKSLTEVRKTNQGIFTKVPITVHYLTSSNSLIGIHLPMVSSPSSQNNFGDLQFLFKYQFYRKDQMGKTFRIIAKTLQTLPTGSDYKIIGISNGIYQGYYALVAGYENVNLGISNELGFASMPNTEMNEWRYKLGFGLPLLPATYPVKQINLYFETQQSWFPQSETYMFLYAQGLQYAIKRLTVETSFQFPLTNINNPLLQRDYSIFLGTRYIF
ncbi:MAG: hypothetical protein ACPHXR_09675 [Flavicella sp.]